jgi:hypothetical protein
MQNFVLWFQTGRSHIMDLDGFDHLLFLAALTAPYLFKDWKRLLFQITAFTIGHTVSLVLSVTNFVSAPSRFVEPLIALTIAATAIFNLQERKFQFKNNNFKSYGLAIFFGLIHGLAFSSYLKDLLGATKNIAAPLFAFNVGLEVGQIIIVIGVLFTAYLMVAILKRSRREWMLFLSGGAFFIALELLIKRWPF